MSHVSKAWKDPQYRASLRDAQLAALPGSPVGAVELDQPDAQGAGAATFANCSYLQCTVSFPCNTLGPVCFSPLCLPPTRFACG